ncbi:protein MGARP [Cinclus cinclus]|uniref:protein MGARP n=1 Tax=Cinclus cinclus TaxID=127875 RepID=UPI002E0D406C
MSFCRAASQALASRLSRAPAAASRLKQRGTRAGPGRGHRTMRGSRAGAGTAPPRQMSSGSVPGSSRDSMMIYLLAGVAAFGGLFYAYRVVSSSRSKYIEHTNTLRERDEGQKSNLWSRKEGDGEEMDEVPEAEKAMEEADAAAAAEPAAQDESAGPTAQDETSGVSPEARGEDELLAPEVSRDVEEAQQEAAANLEAAANSEAAANLELAANSEAAAVQEEQHSPQSCSSQEFLAAGREATSSTWSDTQP